MSFLWGKKKKEEHRDEPLSRAEIDARLQALRRSAEELDRTIYGVALLFEGISLLHAGQPALIETYQKQFRNVIHFDNDTLKQARALLETVERDPGKIRLLEQFQVIPCGGHSNPRDLEQRARVLVDIYDKLFS